MPGLTDEELARYKKRAEEADAWYAQMERRRVQDLSRQPAHRGIPGLRNIDDYSDEELTTCCPLDDLSVVVKDAGELPAVADRVKGAGFEIKGAIFDTVVVKLRAADVGLLRSGFKALENLPGVRLVAPRLRRRLTATNPNDPLFTGGDQWNIQAVNAPMAWDNASVRNANTILAVLDSGVNAVADLGGKLVNGRDATPMWSWNGWSWMSYGTDTTDGEGHGTWVASVAAAITNNSSFIAGVGWSVRIMPMVVTEPRGTQNIYTDDERAAVYWAVDNGARILNLSLGGSGANWFEQDMIQYAGSRGAVLVCAAGNDAGPVNYPAAYSSSYGQVAAVSATTAGNGLWSQSCTGPQVTMAAPGEFVPALTRDGSWEFAHGTSLAAPHVSGAMAAISGACSALPVSVVKWVQEISAQDLGSAGRDSQFGFGLLNYGAAASWLLASGVVYRWIDGGGRHAYTNSCAENMGGHYEGLAFGLRTTQQPGSAVVPQVRSLEWRPLADHQHQRGAELQL